MDGVKGGKGDERWREGEKREIEDKQERVGERGGMG